jgi:CheY-like chemotaxis protein
MTNAPLLDAKTLRAAAPLLNGVPGLTAVGMWAARVGAVLTLRQNDDPGTEGRRRLRRVHTALELALTQLGWPVPVSILVVIFDPREQPSLGETVRQEYADDPAWHRSGIGLRTLVIKDEPTLANPSFTAVLNDLLDGFVSEPALVAPVEPLARGDWLAAIKAESARCDDVAQRTLLLGLYESLRAEGDPAELAERAVTGWCEAEISAIRSTGTDGNVSAHTQGGVYGLNATSTSSPAKQPQLSVLWVDDRPTSISAPLAILRRAGVEVEIVTSTAAALAAQKNKKYSALITDLGRMESGQYDPEAGLNTLRQLAEYISGPKVIYTSQDKVDEIQDQAELLGATLVSADPYEMTTHVLSHLHPQRRKTITRYGSLPEQRSLPDDESAPEQRQESRPRSPRKKAVKKVAMPKKRK